MSSWIGVHVQTNDVTDDGEDYIPGPGQFDCFYSRGRLGRIPRAGHHPILLKGETVRYCSITGNCETQFLQYCQSTDQYLLVVSRRDKKECKKLAKRAEKEYAMKIKNELAGGRFRGSFRPLQPVRLVGGAKGKVLRPIDDGGLITVEVDVNSEPTSPGTKKRKRRSTRIEKKRHHEVRLLGGPEPFDKETFFRINNDYPKQKASYREEPEYLLKAWKAATPNHDEFENRFRKILDDRERVRRIANGGCGNGTMVTAQGMQRLEERRVRLLRRLHKDYLLEKEKSVMTYEDFRSRIVEVKNISPRPNILLLCGGIAPELTAHRRLGAAPPDIVILQDTDLFTVGVAVAAYPDTHFAIVVDPTGAKQPGDVKILRSEEIIREVEIQIGGIHSVSITNPCQSFSLAGKRDGFHSHNGLLLIDCATVVRSIEKSSAMPMYLAENVRSTHELDRESDEYLPDPSTKYFRANGSMCSPSLRDRKFSTNRPPVLCGEGSIRKPDEPPSLDGDLPNVLAESVLSDDSRMVHPKLKKFPCLMFSGAKSECVWQRKGDWDEPYKTKLSPTEAELSMGYTAEEVGVSAYSAEKAVKQRIEAHNAERGGCLVSLKGCADRKDLLTKVDDARRLKILGNSQIVTLLEALMWNERKLFPSVTS